MRETSMVKAAAADSGNSHRESGMCLQTHTVLCSVDFETMSI